MGKGTRIKKELRSHSRAPAPPLDTYARALDALRSGNRAAAIVLLRQVVLAYPRHAQAHFNLATALREQADLQTAIVHYKEALAIEPASVDAMVNLGETLRRSLKTADALTWCDRAVAAAPRHSEAYLIRGVVRHDLGDLPAAVADLRKSIAEAPQVVTGYRMLGQILSRTPRKQEALDILRRGSALAPEDVEFHRLIGDVCDQMGLLGEGFEAYRRAINLDPRDPSTYANFTGLLCKTKLLDVALNVSAIGIALAPNLLQLHFNRGVAFEKLERLEEARQSYGEALRCDPASGRALISICRLRSQICDWAGLAEAETLARMLTYRKNVPSPPFTFLPNTSSLAEVLACNELWSRAIDRGPAPLTRYEPRPVERRGNRIRVGYLSADFQLHATTALIAELFELHDKSRLEIWGYSIGAHDESPVRRRLMAAFDHFHNLADLSYDAAAALIRSHGIDILVDLKGYTYQARAEILARRPAPIQVNFLGYPATMGADFIDYVIGDPIVTPMEHAPYYTEKIVHLPHTYQPNDRKRPIAADGPSRAECGLPDDGFVFCCFNAVHKITADVFEVWTRLLKAIPASVLWLYAPHPAAAANLRREATALGIDPARLVIAPKLPSPYHLARMRHGDLFLDTAPYGAHTTASEALWAGLPVLTIRGSVFAARVGASLVTAVGLPELVAADWSEYEAIARRLAKHPDQLVALKTRLVANLHTEPLFDSVGYAHDFDRALIRMMDIRDAGEEPYSFAVEAQV